MRGQRKTKGIMAGTAGLLSAVIVLVMGMVTPAYSVSNDDREALIELYLLFKLTFFFNFVAESVQQAVHPIHHRGKVRSDSPGIPAHRDLTLQGAIDHSLELPPHFAYAPADPEGNRQGQGRQRNQSGQH